MLDFTKATELSKCKALPVIAESLKVITIERYKFYLYKSLTIFFLTFRTKGWGGEVSESIKYHTQISIIILFLLFCEKLSCVYMSIFLRSLEGKVGILKPFENVSANGR